MSDSTPPSPAPNPPVAPVAPVAPGRSEELRRWSARLTSAAEATGSWASRPRVRLLLIGGTLLVLGGIFVTNSVWTLPIVIVGVVMVIVAWVGHRLDGRIAVEWGESGTEVAFRATIRPVAALNEPAPPALRPAADEAVIEGEAHTIEIDVADLKALIAAAEASEAPIQHDEPSVQDIRIRRAAHSPESAGRSA